VATTSPPTCEHGTLHVRRSRLLGLRWTAAGMLEAERQFGMIIGFSDLARLAVAVERELTRLQPNRVASQQVAIVASA